MEIMAKINLHKCILRTLRVTVPAGLHTLLRWVASSLGGNTVRTPKIGWYPAICMRSLLGVVTLDYIVLDTRSKISSQWVWYLTGGEDCGK